MIDLDRPTDQRRPDAGGPIADPIRNDRNERLGLSTLEADRPRPQRRSVLSKVSTAHFLMVLFGLLGFGSTLYLLQQQDAIVEVVVARGDLAAGTKLDAAAVETVAVPADGPLASTSLRPTELNDQMTLVAAISSGAPVLRSLVTEASYLDDLNAFSVPIGEERALGGEFTAGDRVNLISVIEIGNGRDTTAISTYVATDVPVLADRNDDSSGFGASRLDYFIAVGLDSEQSLGAATALMVGRLEVVRAGEVPANTDMAAITTTGGVANVPRSEVAEILRAAQNPVVPEQP